MKNNFLGEMFIPCFLSEDSFKKGMQSTNYFLKSGFRVKYNEYLFAIDVVSNCAKLYVLNNYKKVSDWSNLNVTITDGDGIETEFYNYKLMFNIEKSSVTMKDVYSELENRREKKHNLVEAITNVVLDYSDGDFSLTINGKDYLWIDDSSIIVIADYIEEQLNN